MRNGPEVVEELAVDRPAFETLPDILADQALAFFTRWSTAERAAFAQANHIDYVLATDPRFVQRLRDDPRLRIVDREGDAAVFQVQP